MNNYEFTENWFHYGEKLWPHLVKQLPQKPNRYFMEIGSFEGRSAVWTIERMMQRGDKLYCIDTWEGSREHNVIDMLMVKRRFDNNIAKACSFANINPEDVLTYEQSSARALGRFLGANNQLWDFIYVDGSHEAADVLRDLTMAWELLAVDGLMVIDDYLWGDPRDPLGRPKVAIDTFINICAPAISVIHTGYQIAIKKVDHD